MHEDLLRQEILVAGKHDRVVLIIKGVEYLLPYAQAFRMSSALSLVSRDAMRTSGQNSNGWRDLSQLQADDTRSAVSETPRSTGSSAPITCWNVDRNGEDVSLHMGNVTVTFHYSNALKLSNWIQLAGRDAKAWAGDTGKTKLAMGTLSNAEENYKRGYL